MTRPSNLLATKEARLVGKTGIRVIRLVMAAAHGPRLFEDFGQAAGYAHRYEEFLELSHATPPTLAGHRGRVRPTGRIKPPPG